MISETPFDARWIISIDTCRDAVLDDPTYKNDEISLCYNLVNDRDTDRVSRWEQIHSSGSRSKRML